MSLFKETLEALKKNIDDEDAFKQLKDLICKKSPAIIIQSECDCR